MNINHNILSLKSKIDERGDTNVISLKGNVVWVSDSVTQQVFEKWWITLALIHPTKDKILIYLMKLVVTLSDVKIIYNCYR